MTSTSPTPSAEGSDVDPGSFQYSRAYRLRCTTCEATNAEGLFHGMRKLANEGVSYFAHYYSRRSILFGGKQKSRPDRS